MSGTALPAAPHAAAATALARRGDPIRPRGATGPRLRDDRRGPSRPSAPPVEVLRDYRRVRAPFARQERRKARPLSARAVGHREGAAESALRCRDRPAASARTAVGGARGCRLAAFARDWSRGAVERVPAGDPIESPARRPAAALFDSAPWFFPAAVERVSSSSPSSCLLKSTPFPADG